MKTLKVVVAIALMSCKALLFGQSTDWVWAKSAGSNGGENYGSSSHTTDNFGNVYITGSFTGAAITFGSIILNNISSNADDADVFIVKYDPSGNVVWAKSAGGNGYDSGVNIAIDETGHLYVIGSFASTSIAFGSSTLVNVDANAQNGYNANHIFIAKYDPSGNPLWAKDAGQGKYDRPNEIKPDNAGNLYVTGQFTHPVIFGNTTLVPSADGGSNVFIVKYDASGNVVWAKSAEAFATHISTDIFGNLYITGTFQSSSITIGNTVLTNTGSGNGAYEMFIAKYDGSGNAVWAKSAGGNSLDMANGITIDQTGNIYITGESYSPSITFDSTILTVSGGDGDVFVAKYDASGNNLWATSVGGIGQDVATAINSDTTGNIYIAGMFLSPSITFGSTVLNNAGGLGGYEIFIVKYEPSGNISWAKSVSLAGSNYDYDVNLSITTNVSGDIYLTGNWLNSTVTFGNTTLTGNGYSIDIFIAKMGVPVGINENETKNNVLVYPNPFYNTAIVHIGPKEKQYNAIFELFDVLGNKVKMLEVNNADSFEINRDNLSEGVYLYRITLNGRNYSTGRLVVQ